MKHIAKNIFRVLFFAAIIWFSFNIYTNATSIKEKKESNAVYFDISHGIFSPTEWKCKVIEIINDRLDSLDVTIESAKLVDYVDSIYRASTDDIRNISVTDSLTETFDNTDGNFFQKSWSAVSSFFSSSTDYLTQQGLDIVLDVLEAYLLQKIEDNDDMIKEMIQDKVTSTINDNLKTKKDSRNYTADCTEQDDVNLLKYDEEEEQLNLFLILFAAVSVGYFALAFLYYSRFENWGKIILVDSIILGIICLVLGVLLPMMEINAQIEDLQFTFLGETITFQNQSVFFRSKSIMDIVVILIFNNAFVAIMIFAFSIFTPFTKLVSSLLILFSRKAANNKVMNWIVQYIGKWSMADVFVVAIFLATLGYQGIISEQMEGLDRIKNLKTTLNTEQSTLDVGFYFFLAYCLISLASSVFIKRFKKS